MTTEIEVLQRGFVLASQDEYALDAPGNEECLRAYRRWLETEAPALTSRWRAGDAFAEDDAPLLWLVRASAIWRGDRAHSRRRQGLDLSAEDAEYADCVRDLERRGREVLCRGYFGETLDGEDRDVLREYRILAERRILRTDVWPYELGIDERGGLPLGQRAGMRDPESAGSRRAVRSGASALRHRRASRVLSGAGRDERIVSGGLADHGRGPPGTNRHNPRPTRRAIHRQRQADGRSRRLQSPSGADRPGDRRDPAERSKRTDRPG